MDFMKSEKVTLDFTSDLFNILVTEINQYIEIMDGEETQEAERIVKKIMRNTTTDVEKDGTEFAVIELTPADASELIFVLSLVAWSEDTEVVDYYTKLKRE